MLSLQIRCSKSSAMGEVVLVGVGSGVAHADDDLFMFFMLFMVVVVICLLLACYLPVTGLNQIVIIQRDKAVFRPGFDCYVSC